MSDKEKDFKSGLLVAGLALMVLAALLLIFIKRDIGTVTGEVILFMIGFGCCVAGTDTTEAEARKAARKSDEWQRPEGPF